MVKGKTTFALEIRKGAIAAENIFGGELFEIRDRKKKKRIL